MDTSYIDIDTLQQISPIFELIGLFLAYVEIRKKALANKIENIIDRIHDVMRPMLAEYVSTISESVDNFIFIGLIPIAATSLFIFFSDFEEDLLSNLLFMGVVVSLTVIFVILPLILSPFLKFLNQYSGGRAIGTLGLLIALIGICMEGIQVADLCLEKGCYGF